MAFRIRKVVGFVFDADGAPKAGVSVKFTLNKPFGYTNLHLVLNDPITVFSDVAGAWVANLWCDEDSLTALDYDVVVSGNQTRTSPISLAFEDGTDKPIGILFLESANKADTIGRETLLGFVDTRIALNPGTGLVALQSRVAGFTVAIAPADELYTLDETSNEDDIRRFLETLVKKLKS